MAECSTAFRAGIEPGLRLPRVIQGPCNKRELQRNPRPERPFGNLREALRMPKHELVNIEEHHQHESDANGGSAPRGRHQQAKAARNLRQPAQLNQLCRMGIMVGHDLPVKLRMPEVVDAGADVKQRLCHEAYARESHEPYYASIHDE